MSREFRQDDGGYTLAIGHIEKEYRRALGNTTRSKEVYQGTLTRLQWLLDLYRREQRELAVHQRQNENGGEAASSRSVRDGEAAVVEVSTSKKNGASSRSKKNGGVEVASRGGKSASRGKKSASRPRAAA